MPETRLHIGELFPSSDHFPLSRTFGRLDGMPEPPSGVRPFGLSVVVPATMMIKVNPAEISYDEERQIGLVREGDVVVPLARHTDGVTNTVTDGGDGQTKNTDSDTDHRED
jgi:putative ATP-grasp target RiPP